MLRRYLRKKFKEIYKRCKDFQIGTTELSQSILFPDKEIKWERNFAFLKQKQNAPVFSSAFIIRPRHPAEYSFHEIPYCKNFKKVICQVVCWNRSGRDREQFARGAALGLETLFGEAKVGSLKSSPAAPQPTPFPEESFFWPSEGAQRCFRGCPRVPAPAVWRPLHFRRGLVGGRG